MNTHTKLLLLSDLHLHVSNIDLDFNNHDVVLIIGDISYDDKQLLNFFSYKIPSYLPTIFVPGNHEYEGHNFYTRDNAIKKLLSPLPHVKVLQNDEFIYDNIRFLGTTLWSDFSLYEPEFSREKAMELAKMKICDYNSIIGRNQLLKPIETLQAHNEAIKWLEYKLKKDPFNGVTIVLSHFLPHPNSINKKYNNQLLNTYFCSNLEHLMGFSDYWLHGHTHDNCNYEIEGTKVLCNPRGYSKLFNLSENQNFNSQFTINIEKPNLKNKIKI